MCACLVPSFCSLLYSHCLSHLVLQPSVKDFRALKSTVDAVSPLSHAFTLVSCELVGDRYCPSLIDKEAKRLSDLP